jgi:hypothetical protein
MLERHNDDHKKSLIMRGKLNNKGGSSNRGKSRSK